MRRRRRYVGCAREAGWSAAGVRTACAAGVWSRRRARCRSGAPTRSPLAAGARGRRTRSRSTRRPLDRFVDRRVSGAAAEVAADRVRHLLAGRTRMRIEQRLRRKQHPRRAVAALRGALFGERGLQRMQLGSFREPLDRRHLEHADLLWQHETGEDLLAIDEDGARATLAELAAVL